MSTLLRAGDAGPAVRDLQERLTRCGHTVTFDGVYGEETAAAVREFQTRRRLRLDGICGAETWGALIESSYALGDRLLYERAPMLRGDDVMDLQGRLNALGYDTGREDGILGPETVNALVRFQREYGLEPDGICGPSTLTALTRVGTLAGGSVASVRERDTLRRQPRRLRDRRVFLVVDPGLAALGAGVARSLRAEGAIVVPDASGDDHDVMAAQANAFGADVCIAIGSGTEPGARCAYFANQTFRSEAGRCLAYGVTAAVRAVLPRVAEPTGQTYRLLRETRMAAVVCELFSRDEPNGVAALAAVGPELARALASGVRKGIEEPIEVA
jgi:N-acetylmuramoyl-L-alanine amidase